MQSRAAMQRPQCRQMHLGICSTSPTLWVQVATFLRYHPGLKFSGLQLESEATVSLHSFQTGAGQRAFGSLVLTLDASEQIKALADPERTLPVRIWNCPGLEFSCKTHVDISIISKNKRARECTDAHNFTCVASLSITVHILVDGHFDSR